MNGERWQAIEELFHATLQRAPEERSTFLAEACGEDNDLRQYVETLISEDERARSLLERPILSDVTATLADCASLVGQQVGTYHILSLLGAGGMGEVYRAHDARLGRDVALKVLPATFARDSERLARFHREARTIASLNHPNIAAIYGLEKSGQVDYLVLELVEGGTLEGPRPVAEALDAARQVAEALEAAHGKGIVHRDLKPANVKITPEGRVKVLDFGLAKAISVPDTALDRSQLATVTHLQTLAGEIVGTPAYMSPEQARGQQLDQRTDIWAFGCLLYELLSGKRAFPGNTVAETIAAVLEREPDWRSLPSKTPGSIHKLLRRCLEKDPERRLATAHEALKIIRRSQRARSPRTVAVAAVLIAVIAGAAAIAWRFADRQRTAMNAATIARITADSGLTAYPALSPDGKHLAYASDRASDGNLDIWMQQVSGGNPVRLTSNAADELEPNFSPDGERIVFRSERDGGGVYDIPALGGVERRLADLGRRPRYSPDGRWIVYWVGDQSYFGRRQIFVVPANGGQPLAVQTSFYSASFPVWSPDSKHLLFRGVRDAKAAEKGEFDWWVSSFDGGEAIQTGASQLLRQTKLASMERSQLGGGFGVDPAEWMGDFIIFSSSSGSAGISGGLWRAGISSRYRVEGPVQRLTSGTENQIQPSSAGARIAFASVSQHENIWSLRLDPSTGTVSGQPQPVTTTAAADVLPTLAANGNRVAFASSRDGNMQVWVKDLVSGGETPLTSGSLSNLPWLLSGDGSRLVYCAYEPNTANGKHGCFSSGTSGAASKRICEKCTASSILDWFEDGRSILYKRGLTADTELVLNELDSGRESVLLSYPGHNVTAARFSPDRRWMSFQMVIDAATKRQIFIAPIRNGVAAPQPEWIPVTDGSGLDRNAVWSADGNILYFLSERDGFRCFWAQRLAPKTKRPVGPAFAAYHFHQARHSLMPAQEVARIGLSVARDKIVFSMAGMNGNIWLANFE